MKDASDLETNDITGIGKYRFLLFADSFANKNEAKLKTLTASRLTQTNLAREEGTLSVHVERIPDDVGRYHLEVTVSQRYGFLLGEFLEIVGQGAEQTMESTVYVAGTDVAYYMNMIQTSANLWDLMGESEILGIVSSAISMVNNVAGTVG